MKKNILKNVICCLLAVSCVGGISYGIYYLNSKNDEDLKSKSINIDKETLVFTDSTESYILTASIDNKEDTDEIVWSTNNENISLVVDVSNNLKCTVNVTGIIDNIANVYATLKIDNSILDKVYVTTDTNIFSVQTYMSRTGVDGIYSSYGNFDLEAFKSSDLNFFENEAVKKYNYLSDYHIKEASNSLDKTNSIVKLYFYKEANEVKTTGTLNKYISTTGVDGTYTKTSTSYVFTDADTLTSLINHYKYNDESLLYIINNTKTSYDSSNHVFDLYLYKEETTIITSYTINIHIYDLDTGNHVDDNSYTIDSITVPTESECLVATGYNTSQYSCDEFS
ncbi:MAG: hypothetical protein WC174_02545, partial [Bacilli bacterium]